MKNLIFLLAILLFTTPFSQAQTETTPPKSSSTSKPTRSPRPPRPPRPSKPVRSVKTRTSDGYNYERSSTDNQSNSSISISSSDDTYQLKAYYPTSKIAEVKSLLIKEMGKNNLELKDGTYQWMVKSGQKQVYKILLNHQNLNMTIDKTIASPSLIDKFEDIGLLIKSIITDDKDGHADQLQRDADQLRADAKRMEREADRLLNIAHEDSKRLEVEAKILREKAKKIELTAGQQGGVSTIVKKLLKEDRTIISNQSNVNNLGWTWPKVQVNLISYLTTSELINSNETISLVKETAGIYLNGEKIETKHLEKINQILNFGNFGTAEFQFYKDENHIVIINQSSDIIGFFKVLKSSGHLFSLNTKTHLEINGYNVIKNGIELDEKETKVYNSLLELHGILPAPGKIIELSSKGNYKLGYSINDKAHIGTWIKE